MLTVEHELAEALRHQRLKAYAVHHTARHGFSWLYALLRLRAPAKS